MLDQKVLRIIFVLENILKKSSQKKIINTQEEVLKNIFKLSFKMENTIYHSKIFKI